MINSILYFSGENIADNGGLKAAYNAYIRSKSTSDVDRLALPGLNMTHSQLFFVSFAQVLLRFNDDDFLYFFFLLFSSLYHRYGVQRSPRRQQTFKSRKILIRRPSSVSSVHCLTWKNFQKFIIVRSDRPWIQKTNVKFGEWDRSESNHTCLSLYYHSASFTR